MSRPSYYPTNTEGPRWDRDDRPDLSVYETRKREKEIINRPTRDLSETRDKWGKTSSEKDAELKAYRKNFDANNPGKDLSAEGLEDIYNRRNQESVDAKAANKGKAAWQIFGYGSKDDYKKSKWKEWENEKYLNRLRDEGVDTSFSDSLRNPTKKDRHEMGAGFPGGPPIQFPTDPKKIKKPTVKDKKPDASMPPAPTPPKKDSGTVGTVVGGLKDIKGDKINSKRTVKDKKPGTPDASMPPAPTPPKRGVTPLPYPIPPKLGDDQSGGVTPLPSPTPPKDGYDPGGVRVLPYPSPSPTPPKRGDDPWFDGVRPTDPRVTTPPGKGRDGYQPGVPGGLGDPRITTPPGMGDPRVTTPPGKRPVPRPVPKKPSSSSNLMSDNDRMNLLTGGSSAPGSTGGTPGIMSDNDRMNLLTGGSSASASGSTSGTPGIMSDNDRMNLLTGGSPKPSTTEPSYEMEDSPDTTYYDSKKNLSSFIDRMALLTGQTPGRW